MTTEGATAPNDPTDHGHEVGLPDDPAVDPGDVGLPSDPDLDDDNVVVTPPNADDVPGSAAG
jgi:hypothetical protein